MQLPGISFDPVRLSLDVTWWPDDNTFGMSRRLWTRPHRADIWQLEDMATTGTPVRLEDLPDRWSESSAAAFRFFLDLVHTQGDPF